MPTLNEQQCILLIKNIILSADRSDQTKARLVSETIQSFAAHNINIPQVVQDFGNPDSPVRLAIMHALPRTFAVMHEQGGHMEQFDRRHRSANHSFTDLVALMRVVPAFAADAPGNFGFGGVIGQFSGSACSWLKYFLGELDIEVGAECAEARMEMFRAGFRLPTDSALAMVYSRSRDGTLACRPSGSPMPLGHVEQGYVQDPTTGYRRLAPAHN